MNLINDKIDRILTEIADRNLDDPVYQKAKHIASFDNMPVLITGETGTGKEILARYIQNNSPRKDKPFVIVNMGSIPTNLVSSELFGHIAGAFTDARKDKKGFIEEANGGTIFLDEIGDISLEAQTALLRFLDYNVIKPVGASKEISVDVRVIAATNVDLDKKLKTGHFREDFSYRLIRNQLKLKPLRERTKPEIKGTIENIIADFSRENNVAEIKLDSIALETLLNYKFPGNYREARNIVESLYTINKDIIDVNDLSDLHIAFPTKPDNAFKELNPFDLITENSKKSPTLEDKVAYIVYDTVRKHNGTVKHAAYELDITEKTIKKYLKHYHSMENFSGKIPIGDRKNSERKNEND